MIFLGDSNDSFDQMTSHFEVKYKVLPDYRFKLNAKFNLKGIDKKKKLIYCYELPKETQSS